MPPVTDTIAVPVMSPKQDMSVFEIAIKTESLEHIVKVFPNAGEIQGQPFAAFRKKPFPHPTSNTFGFSAISLFIFLIILR